MILSAVANWLLPVMQVCPCPPLLPSHRCTDKHPHLPVLAFIRSSLCLAFSQFMKFSLLDFLDLSVLEEMCSVFISVRCLTL